MSEGPWADFASIPQGSGPWESYQEPETGALGQELPPPKPEDVAKEEPETMGSPGLQDVSIPDAMTVESIPGMAKLGVGLLAKGAGAALNAIPATENIIPSIERMANNQTMKSMGGTMGQIRQMAAGRSGREALDDAAKYARDNGLADVFSTQIGREKQLQSLMDASGEKIGALRNEAGAAPAGIEGKIIENPKMAKYLGKGSASKQIGGVEEALQDIKEVGGENPTHASLADAATEINKNAAGEKLYQPVNAKTDTANILSDENNQGIAQSLGSDKAKQYVNALDEQSKLHPLEHLQEHGELRNAGGRGSGGSMMHNIIQAIADKVGYRLSAKTMAAIADALNGEELARGGALQDYLMKQFSK